MFRTCSKVHVMVVKPFRFEQIVCILSTERISQTRTYPVNLIRVFVYNSWLCYTFAISVPQLKKATPIQIQQYYFFSTIKCNKFNTAKNILWICWLYYNFYHYNIFQKIKKQISTCSYTKNIKMLSCDTFVLIKKFVYKYTIYIK